MTSSTGYLKKILSKCSSAILLALALFTSLLPTHLYASSEDSAAGFTQTTSIIYTINSEGTLSTEIQLHVIPEEGAANVVKFFTITLPFKQIDNVGVKKGDRAYTVSHNDVSEGTRLVVDLNNLTIDRTRGAQFRITFSKGKFMQEGESSELPLHISSTTSEHVKITLNSPFDDLLIPVLKGMTIIEQNNQKIINFASPENDSLLISGSDQFVYEFSINKQFVNTDEIQKTFEVNIPKIGNGQKLLIDEVTEPPSKVLMDPEGNLSLRYTVPAESELKVKIEGLIKFEEGTGGTLQFEQFENSTKKADYWDLSDETELKRIDLYIQNGGIVQSFERDARKLSTEEQAKLANILYRYVLDRLGSQNELDTATNYRQGKRVLENPAIASAADYNDFLIAVLRAYSIPSRLTQGYISDSSGVYESGFIHSWVEVWDNLKGWIVLDPVIEVITGIQMYDPLFKDHVAFVTRSYNPFKPQLGFFLNEDIEVSLTDRNFTEILSASSSQIIDGASILNPASSAKFTIHNDGNSIISSVSFDFEDNFKENSFEEDKSILIFPGQEIEITGSLVIEEENLAAKNRSAALRGDLNIVSLYGTERTYILEDSVNIRHYWWWDTFVKLISLFIFLMLALLAVNVAKAIKKVIYKEK
ncbi:MAG: transglutaminase domain-containing protein [Candidatus Dojkabacteria bacterium]|nr:MAG: transglutaminase domain-containing protein [Candidatus Dojkabacteria bacterium]